MTKEPSVRQQGFFIIIIVIIIKPVVTPKKAFIYRISYFIYVNCLI